MQKPTVWGRLSCRFVDQKYVVVLLLRDICMAQKGINLLSSRLTSPGIGRKWDQIRLVCYYQGLFIAPHTVAEALKGNINCLDI